MAKLSARNCHEIATLNGNRHFDGDAWPVRLALRSDGVVLMRNRGTREYESSSYRSGASGYKMVARFDRAVFPGLLEKHGAEKILRSVAKQKGVVADDSDKG